MSEDNNSNTGEVKLESRRGKHKMYRHLFMPGYISKEAYDKLKVEDEELAIIPGEPLSVRQLERLRDYKNNRDAKFTEKRDEVERLKRQLSLEIDKGSDIEKMTPLARKLIALDFDVVSELVILYKGKGTKANEKIRILELMADFVYQKNKPVDTQTGDNRPTINVQINTYPELRGQPAKVEVIQTQQTAREGESIFLTQ